MLENKNKFGFTLSELITALGIIGILAAMSVPALFENIHKRTAVAQLKSIVGEVQQVAQNQMALKGTKDLSLTDFSSPDKLFNDKNFMIVKKCSASTALADCWNVSSTKKYKNIEGKDHANPDATVTVILKNGAILGYKAKVKYNYTGLTENNYGVFYVDVNGQDKPNVVGRDRFAFVISQQGNIYSGMSSGSGTVDSCKSSTSGQFVCFDVVVTSGWQMNY